MYNVENRMTAEDERLYGALFLAVVLTRLATIPVSAQS